MNLIIDPISEANPTRSVAGKILENSSVLAIRLAAGLVINALGGILLARLLGPRVWGIFAISLFLLVSYQVILEKGLVAYLIQKQDDLTSGEKDVSYAIQISLGLFCLLFAVFILAPLGARWLGDNDLSALIVGSGLAGFAYSVRSVPLALLERELKYFHVGLIEIGDMLSFNVVAIGCILVGLGIQGLLIGTIMRGLVSTVMAIAFSEKPGIAWDTQAARRMLGFGVPVFGSNLLKVLASAADPILVSTLAGPQAWGFVQVAYTLLNYPGSLGGILTRVSFSALSRIQDRADELGALSAVNVQTLSKFLLPLVAGLAGLSPIWVPWVYGTEWLPLSQTLAVAALPIAAGQVFLTLTASLYAKGRADRVFGFLFLYNLLYWGADLLFIPRYGQLGSPLALWASAPLWIILVWNYRAFCGTLAIESVVKILFVSTLAIGGIFLSIELGWWGITWMLTIGFFLWWLSICKIIFAAGITFFIRALFPPKSSKSVQ